MMVVYSAALLVDKLVLEWVDRLAAHLVVLSVVETVAVMVDYLAA